MKIKEESFQVSKNEKTSNDFIRYFNEKTGDFKDEYLGREY